MMVRVGPFTVATDLEWPVRRGGREDGFIVLDAAPGRERPREGEVTPGGVWPVLVVRFFEERVGRNVVSAALREAFVPQTSVTPSALLLSYEAFETDSGLPGRRHHVVLEEDGRPVHSVRWYVGHGRMVLEQTLTVGEDVADGLLAACEEMVRSISAAALGAVPPLEISSDAEDEWPATVVGAGSAVMPVPESVQRGHLHFLRGVGESQLSPSAQDAAWKELRHVRPAMRGLYRGPAGDVVCEMHPRGTETFVVRRTPADGRPGGEDVQVWRVPTSTAVLHALIAADLRADWPRDISAMGQGGVDVTDPAFEWTIAAGGESAARIMVGPREHWRWTDDSGRVAAEWVTPEGAAPMALFPDKGGQAVLAGATTAARLYGHLSLGWAEVLTSADVDGSTTG